MQDGQAIEALKDEVEQLFGRQALREQVCSNGSAVGPLPELKSRQDQRRRKGCARNCGDTEVDGGPYDRT